MRAILAVYDKEGIREFAQSLLSMGCEIIATGGTAKSISDAGIPVTEIADLTGSPEMFGGQLFTEGYYFGAVMQKMKMKLKDIQFHLLA